jgi:FG-GAP repeat protein
VGRDSGAGAVNVLYGSASGLSTANDQVVTQDSAGIGGVAERGDSLGDSVAAGDFNGDNRDDLAAGAPSEDVGRHRGAGGVNVIYGSASGLTSARDQVLTQNTAGVPGAAESADGLGRRLAAGDLNGDGAAELVAGAPEENLGRDVNAGGFHVLVGSSSGLVTSGSGFITQDSRGVQGSAERQDRLANALPVGDFNGDGRGDLAAGAPGEGIGRARGAGVVHAFYGTASGLSVSGDQLWCQNSAGIRGRAERDDAFGDALGTADGDGDEHTDLVVGAPGEQVGRSRGAGSVNVI